MPLHRWEKAEGAKWAPQKWTCGRCGASVNSEEQPYSRWDKSAQAPVLVVKVAYGMVADPNDDGRREVVSKVSGECDEECVRGVLES